MAGILLADYFLVHRRELHLDDLYIGNHSSAYWYTAGFNWRAPVAWYAKSLPPSSFLPLASNYHSVSSLLCAYPLRTYTGRWECGRCFPASPGRYAVFPLTAAGITYFESISLSGWGSRLRSTRCYMQSFQLPEAEGARRLEREGMECWLIEPPLKGVCPEKIAGLNVIY